MLGLTAVVLAATMALAWWSFRYGFLNYLNSQEVQRLEHTAEDLAELYIRLGSSWEGLHELRFDDIIRRHDMRPRPPRGPEAGRPPPPRMPPPHRRDKERNTWLTDAQDSLVAGSPQAPPLLRVPVILDGKTIATLSTSEHTMLSEPLETRFAGEQSTTMAAISLAAVALAALIALAMARALLAPIRRTISGVDALTGGAFETRLNDTRTDELGALMRNIDRLAASLQSGQNARRRWIADISHELRTPISVLSAELEAVRDGVRALSEEQLDSFAQEVERLKRLVEDLYDLSLSDLGGLRYEFEDVDLVRLLEPLIDDRRARHPELQIECLLPPRCLMRGDAQRLTQLFVNLLENACAYTDTPGNLAIRLDAQAQDVLVTIDDSPPGVEEASLHSLFEPLYRQDNARDRRRGGAGLGLAICANIAQAHGGSISAHPSPLGGLRVQLRLEIR